MPTPSTGIRSTCHFGGGPASPTARVVFPTSPRSTRALRLVRDRADEWGVDEKRVGALGFSAGGHLASLLSTQPTLCVDPSDDRAPRVPARPDFVILAYPLVPAAHAQRFAEACTRAGVPVTFELFPHGPHGLGLALDQPGDVGQWTRHALDWLARILERHAENGADGDRKAEISGVAVP